MEKLVQFYDLDAPGAAAAAAHFFFILSILNLLINNDKELQ